MPIPWFTDVPLHIGCPRSFHLTPSLMLFSGTPHQATFGKGLLLISLTSAVGTAVNPLVERAAYWSEPIGCYMPELPVRDAAPAPMPGGTSFVVTVATKINGQHPQFGVGNALGFTVDGDQGMELFLVRGTTYTFSITGGHPFAFNPGPIGAGVAPASYPASNGITGTPTGTGTVTFTPNASYPNLIYYVCDAHANMGWKINLSDPPLQVNVKAFLEGPFDGASSMSDALRAGNHIPTTEPYTGLGYTHTGGGGGETVAPAVLAITGPNAVVDWVAVELRDDADPTAVLATRSALLQRDGDVVGTSGGGSVVFNQPPGNYHVALRHRNHLGVMTLAALTFGTSAVNVDLTSAGTLCFGTNARKTAGTMQVLWSGDVVRDGTLKYTGTTNDRDPILVTIGGTVPTNTLVGYHSDDVNLDAVVKYTGTLNDRDPILVNIGGTVPTLTREEQLP
jgi:hypothetical protein